MSDLVEANYDYLAHHRRWYDTYGKLDHLKRWEQLLTSQPEAAICEALVREELERYVDLVYPNEDLSSGGPDFKCYQKTDSGQRHFYVDSACLTIDAVTKATGLKHPSNGGAVGYGLLTERFKNACRSKSQQLSNLDAPSLIAIGTLHMSASQACFHPVAAGFVLTSETLISQRINLNTGDPIGDTFLSTDMKKSAFQRPKGGTPWILEDASRSVSGLLLCPFGGGRPFNLHGVLHPNAVRPFDVELLPGIPFSTLKPGDGTNFDIILMRHDRG